MSEQKKIELFVGNGKASRGHSPSFAFAKRLPVQKRSGEKRRETSPLEHRCPKCGSTKVRRSVRRGVLEYLFSLFGVSPYDCTYYTCLHRFYRRWSKSLTNSDSLAEPVDTIAERSRSISDRLYDGTTRETSLKQTHIDSQPQSEQQQSTSVEAKNNSSPSNSQDSSRYDFLPLSQLQPRQVLTLNWNDRGQQKNHIIYSQNSDGVAGRIKLGRDPSQCDLLFTDRTVSGVNAEIYFDCQSQNFLLSNLRAINPPFLDRKKVVSTTALKSGLVLYLGRVPITIEISFDYAEIEPTLGFDEPTHLFGREDHSN